VDPNRLTRGALGGAIAAAGAGASVLAAEVWAAARRRYASAGSAPPVEGDFGDPGGERLRLVMLGDSTGAGVGVTRTEDTVGGVLARRLAGPTRRVRLAGAAIAGSGTGDLGPQVSRALLGRPDVAVLLVGMTDATSGTALQAVKDNLGDAVRRLAGGGAAVVVGTCLDLGASRVFAQPLRSVVAWRGRRVAAASAEATRDAGGVPVDLAELVGPVFRADRAAYCEDGFHPSADGYRLIAEALLPVVDDAATERATLQ
jgi:lysophospholipase L1-like esterase